MWHICKDIKLFLQQYSKILECHHVTKSLCTVSEALLTDVPVQATKTHFAPDVLWMRFFIFQRNKPILAMQRKHKLCKSDICVVYTSKFRCYQFRGAPTASLLFVSVPTHLVSTITLVFSLILKHLKHKWRRESAVNMPLLSSINRVWSAYGINSTNCFVCAYLSSR